MTLHRNGAPIACVLLTAVLLVSCGSDSGSPTTGNGGASGGNTDNNGTDTAGPGAMPGNSMSHAGTLVPGAPAIPNDPLISSAGQQRAANLGNALGVIYEVIENHSGDAGENCKTLGAEFASCSVVNLHVKDASGSLNSGNWRLYFHSIRRILRVDSDELQVAHVNGDLHYVEPATGFQGFSGDVKTLKMITEFSHLVESDFMPRYWVVRDGAAAELVANTDSDTDESSYAMPITGDNRRAFNGEAHELATPSSRHTKNQPLTTRAAGISAGQTQARVIPRPTTTTVSAGALDIGNGFSFQAAAGLLTTGTINALTARQAQFMSTSAGTALTVSLDATLNSNSYQLDVTSAGITLRGSDEAALFHGAQSLLGLVQPGVGTIPLVSITDQPRFAFRGMHVDVARNFHSVASLQRLMDQMAAYKLNKLHLHLSDDEGWRLEIPSLPELTSIGSRRLFQLDANGDVTETSGLMPQLGSGPGTTNQGTGFFSQQEFIGLLQYATDRYIEVIPAFDMPAHARAAVVAMRVRAANSGQADDINIRLDDPADTSRYLTVQHYDDGILNPCLPGTYNFIDTVIGDVVSMYATAGAPLNIWHMGGDEAKNIFKGGGFQDADDPDKESFQGDTDLSATHFPWEQSPACTRFISQTDGLDNREGLTPYFVKRVADSVAAAGIPALYAYQDIYGGLDAADLSTTRAGAGFWETVWNGGFNSANAISNRGFDTIIAVPDYLYFDFAQEVDPEERGFYWATRFTDTAKVFAFAPENLPQNAETSVNLAGNSWSATGDTTNQGFAGMQGHLWSETVRTAEQFDYMIFPRLMALAERAWHKAAWERPYTPGENYSGQTSLVDRTALQQDYAEFANALSIKELLKLDAAGVAYRIPVPGASVTEGALDMNSALPGLPLQYSTDGTTWSDYPNSTGATAAMVRAMSANGARAGRADSLLP